MTLAKLWDPTASAWVPFAGGPTYAQHAALESRVTALETRPIVTALPSSPFDGQEIYYQNNATLIDGTNTMAALGIVWHLRYRQNTGKWQFLGGSPISTEELAARTAALTAGTYVSWGISIPAYLTVPLPGEYEIDCSCSIAAATQISAQFYYNGARDTTWTFYATEVASSYDILASSRRLNITGGSVTVHITGSASVSSTNYSRRIRGIPVQLG